MFSRSCALNVLCTVCVASLVPAVAHADVLADNGSALESPALGYGLVAILVVGALTAVMLVMKRRAKKSSQD